MFREELLLAVDSQLDIRISVLVKQLLSQKHRICSQFGPSLSLDPFSSALAFYSDLLTLLKTQIPLGEQVLREDNLRRHLVSRVYCYWGEVLQFRQKGGYGEGEGVRYSQYYLKSIQVYPFLGQYYCQLASKRCVIF